MELKEVIHFYLGCEIKLNGGSRQTLSGIEKDKGIWIYYDEGRERSHYFSSFDFKLLLRPLTDIKSKECDEYNKLNGTLFNMADLINQVMQQSACVNFLLSKHFDLFGLIESGQAIDKTKQ